MRKGSRLAICLAAAVLVLLSANAGFAQSLDGKWFRVVGDVKTKAVNMATGKFVTHDFQVVFFLHLTYAGAYGVNGSLYDYEIYCRLSPGAGGWVITAQDTERDTSPYSENFFPDFWMILGNPAGDLIAIYNTPFISGANPNTFKSTGEVYAGVDAQGRVLYGGIQMTGASVTALPFTPVQPTALARQAPGSLVEMTPRRTREF